MCLVVRDGQLREWTKGAIPLEFGSNNLISCYLHILHLPGCAVDDEIDGRFLTLQRQQPHAAERLMRAVENEIEDGKLQSSRVYQHPCAYLRP